MYFSEAIGIPHPQVSRTITISAIIDVIVSIVEVCSEGLILGFFPRVNQHQEFDIYLASQEVNIIESSTEYFPLELWFPQTFV